MPINDIFEIGRQGIEANRRALNTTSNNVSNANTPGYSRQRAVLASNAKSTVGGTILGGGVRVDRVMRIHNDFVQGQILEEARAHGGYKARADGLTRIETQIFEQGKALGSRVNDFFNSFRELSTNPENATLKLNAINATEDVGRAFQKTTGTLEALKKEIDIHLMNVVGDVNQMTKEIASLNEAIKVGEAVRDVPNELLDRREAILRELSGKLGFQIHHDESGSATVLSGGVVLVQGNQVNELEATRTPAKGSKGDGSVEITMRDRYGNRFIPVRVEDGELGGIVHIRDSVINPMLNQLDAAANRLSSAVNTAHAEGLDVEGNSGLPLFVVPEEVSGSGSLIKMNPILKENPDALGRGLTLAPGDNRVALSIAEISEVALMPEFFTTSPDAPPRLNMTESLNSMLSFLGVETQRERNFFESSDRVMSQLENYRESVSGVALEEEAINLIQFQHAFNAAAKTTKVGDELLETILSIKT